MAPFDLANTVGTTGIYLIALLLGIGFGATLELSGFGDSRKLAAQFYLSDMTVLKVMFTAIITAGTLLTLSSAFGLLDFNRVWINPTFLYPGIVGGLIMGVGFVIGGFCPGTSLVASSTLKIDGMFFITGVAIGIFAFGESVESFMQFFISSDMGRFTVGEWLGVSKGVAMLLVVIMALFMFYGGEISERVFGKKLPLSEIDFIPHNKAKIVAALVLVGLVTVSIGLGQPTSEEKWSWIAKQEEPKLENRDVYVHPAEVVDLRANFDIYVTILDLRSEHDYNLFHVMGARRTTMDELNNIKFLKQIKKLPANNVTFVMSNNDTDATKAYKELKAEGVTNIYIVDGGINKWLETYPLDPCVANKKEKLDGGEEELAYNFLLAVGEYSKSSHPDCQRQEFPTDCYLKHHPESLSSATKEEHHDPPKIEYTPKVKIKKKKAVSGGCG